MPSNKRQKELARRRAERYASRRAAERSRKRKRRVIAGVSALGVAAIIGLAVVIASAVGGDDKPTASPTETPSPKAETVACGATKPAAVKKQTFKKPEEVLDTKKTYTVSMKTSCGTISWELFDDQAPKTANSLVFLAGKKFYDGSFCHRMTASEGLNVLQCGDPDGTGAGGPGYTLPEENLTGAKYTRGFVAMAKTQAPNSTGSQFFLINKDSQLPPEYTIIGKMDEASLKVLDTIAKIGIEPDGASDGPPKQKVYIETFRVTAK